MLSTRGVIRKISFGDLKDGLAYKVGQSMFGGKLTITAIVQDDLFFNEYGKVRYDVYVKKIGEDVSTMWKSFIDLPIGIEYNMDNTQENATY